MKALPSSRCLPVYLLWHLSSRTCSSLLLCEFLPDVVSFWLLYGILTTISGRKCVSKICMCTGITSAKRASYPFLNITENNRETNTITGNNNRASGKPSIQTYMRTCLPIRLSWKYSIATWWLLRLRLRENNSNVWVLVVFSTRRNLSATNTLTSRNTCRLFVVWCLGNLEYTLVSVVSWRNWRGCMRTLWGITNSDLIILPFTNIT